MYKLLNNVTVQDLISYLCLFFDDTCLRMITADFFLKKYKWVHTRSGRLRI